MKKNIFSFIIFAFLSFLLVNTINGQWVLQNSNTTSRLNTVFALGTKSCIVAGDSGIILRSSDGGNSWLSNNQGTSNLRCVFFLNENKGWIAGDSGVIYRTNNGGLNWTQVNSGTVLNLNAIQFVNAKTGWAAGDSGIMLKTTNSGTNWYKINWGLNRKLSAMYFLNAYTGWMAGYSIIKTTDGGNNWIIQDSITDMRDICFIDANTGWKSGHDYTISESTDGGYHWGANIPTDPGDSPPAVYTGVAFTNSQTGWFTSSHSFGGKISSTTNGGINWFTEYPTTRYRGLSGISMRKNGIGWAIGAYGTILKRQVTFADSGKYMPLGIGNKWVYNVYRDGGGNYNRIMISRITKDTLISAKKYYYLENSLISGQNYWLRYDDSTGKLLCYSSTSSGCGNELEIADFSATEGDSSTTCYYEKSGCSEGTDTTFGFLKTTKTYSYGRNTISFTARLKKYLYNIGPGKIYTAGGHSIIHTATSILKGAYINGVLYGDTSNTVLTGELGGILKTPEKYSISQNYPNPFNPVTRFKIDISKASNTKIKVYDITGREAATLVNEKLEPGTYEVIFDGSKFNSGVYFVRMTAGDFSETRRMVLLK